MDLTDPVFRDENKAREWLEAQRWPEGPICPHCGNSDQEKITRMQGKAHRPGLYKCNECREQFTVRIGSVMERSKIPLTKWALAMFLMAASKKGVSAHQIHRTLNLPYNTTWFLLHRIREAMDDSKDYRSNPMGGSGKQILSDETYYGRSKKSKFYKKGHRHLWSIVTLIDPERKEARAFHVKTANTKTVRDVLVRNASRKSTLVTDDANLYRQIGPEFERHVRVRHASGRYVTEDGFTTNPVETFFSIFKRGMRGVYQHCGEQHLQRYLHEFDFRYTHRELTDTERAGVLVRGAEGKRLTYQRPKASAV